MSGQRLYFFLPVPTNKILVYTSPIVVNLFVCSHLSDESVRWVQLFDKDSVPIDDDVPVAYVEVGPDGFGSYTPATRGRRFDNGFAVGLSNIVEKFADSEANEMHFWLEGRFLPP